MTFKLPVETPALNVPGMPQFLREIWAHLHLSSPSPTYRVLCSRRDGTYSEFIATVYLRTEPVDRGHTYALSSSITHQVNRAIQEAAADVIILLRTHDPRMKKCTRYVHLPRLDLGNGDVLFPNPGNPSPELTTLLQYTSYLHQYLQIGRASCRERVYVLV